MRTHPYIMFHWFSPDKVCTGTIRNDPKLEADNAFSDFVFLARPNLINYIEKENGYNK